MNTTVESLRDLFVAKGGDLSEVENINTIPDMIDAITSITDKGVPITSDEVDSIIRSVN